MAASHCDGRKMAGWPENEWEMKEALQHGMGTK
jgi:hypothetical protein